ncbi:tail protein X [Methylopila sp. 73B]|uniref:tail protein X n=1 Tax=Methylopila sp. 73B TaxID=1120792 RepID=UPI00037B7560|nr:tail protein X [Methylopila sp. 73B]
MTVYEVTSERERLDRIAKAVMGAETGGGIEALLAANPALASNGPFAPFQTKVVAGDATPTRDVATALTRPWE